MKNTVTVKISEKSGMPRIFRILKNRKAFRRNRELEEAFGGFFWTLYKPVWTDSARTVARILNMLLAVLWLPIFTAGVYMLFNVLPYLNDNYIISGNILGIAAGMMFHEMGHAFACVSYGGETYEIGLAVKYFIPGAYALIEKEDIKHRMQRVQVHAAGVEMNFLLTGMFLLMSVYIPAAGSAFLCAAINNFLMALLNLTLADGLDGMYIMSELLGTDNIFGKTVAVLKNGIERKKLKSKGINGYVTFIVCCLAAAVSLIIPMLIFLNAAEVIVLCVSLF